MHDFDATVALDPTRKRAKSLAITENILAQ
jgi:hypothetical protein